jgi:Glycosyl hydrolases family 38 N-terminal domain
VTAAVGYNIDSFGHRAGLPQLLAHSGLTSYVMMRPDDTEKDLPGRAFHWQGPDGTGVPAHRILFDYSTRGGPEDELIRNRASDPLAGQVSGPAERGPLMCFFGIGDHGGGLTGIPAGAASQLAAAWEPVLTGQALAAADRLTTQAAHAIGQRVDTWVPGAETAEGIEFAIEGLPVPLMVFKPRGRAAAHDHHAAAPDRRGLRR